MDMDGSAYKILGMLASHADMSTLIQLRRLGKHSKQLADAEPLMQEVFKKPGWQRCVTLDAKLRGSDNKTRWRSIEAAKADGFAALLIAKHIRLKPKSAPSLALVMDCLHEVDGHLRLPPFRFGIDARRGGSEYTFGDKIHKLGGGDVEYAIRHAFRGNFLELERVVKKECKWR
jgi:hypothetical protein